MKRIYFVIAIFLALCLMIGFGTYYVNQANDKLMGYLDKIEVAIQNDDVLAAVKYCDEAERDWIKQEEKLNLFVNHEEVCGIGVAISSLKPLIAYNERAEFLSKLAEVRTMIVHLSAMENIKN